MGNESFIEGKQGNGRKEGRHSTMQRLFSAMDQLAVWRHERALSHEVGQMPPEIEEGLVEGYLPAGEGTEIELFVDPLVRVREEINALQTPADRPTYEAYPLGGEAHRK